MRALHSLRSFTNLFQSSSFVVVVVVVIVFAVAVVVVVVVVVVTVVVDLPLYSSYACLRFWTAALTSLSYHFLEKPRLTTLDPTEASSASDVLEMKSFTVAHTQGSVQPHPSAPRCSGLKPSKLFFRCSS